MSIWKNALNAEKTRQEIWEGRPCSYQCLSDLSRHIIKLWWSGYYQLWQLCGTVQLVTPDDTKRKCWYMLLLPADWIIAIQCCLELLNKSLNDYSQYRCRCYSGNRNTTHYSCAEVLLLATNLSVRTILYCNAGAEVSNWLCYYNNSSYGIVPIADGRHSGHQVLEVILNNTIFRNWPFAAAVLSVSNSPCPTLFVTRRCLRISLPSVWSRFW